jgi:hypothetical protein
MITIEITESVSSLDSDYVAAQIKRFHDVGFKVWMDDFGSGYSSLNMLQKFDFDLIKFDMRFMREFNMSKKNHIVLNELIKMTTKLGIDTVVEGVETIEQVKFLREIGCSKMQGYYFAKPIALNEWYAIYGAKVGNKIESLVENKYYDAISKTNVIEPLVNENYRWKIDDFFGQLPTGIIELKDEWVYVLRYNRNFANFLLKFNYIDEVDLGNEMIRQKNIPSDSFLNRLRDCKEYDNWEIVEGVSSQGYMLNIFVKKISKNPVTGTEAFQLVVLSIDDKH